MVNVVARDRVVGDGRVRGPGHGPGRGRVVAPRRDDGSRHGLPGLWGRATGHGRSTVQVRDLPNGSGPVRLVWRKRRWRCSDPDCERQTFTEQSELVEGSLTRGPGPRSAGRSGKVVTRSPSRPVDSVSAGRRRDGSP